MKFKQRILCRSLLLFGYLLIAFSGPVQAYDFSVSVFQFQQKLATKGDPQAQYKLGYMYENGQGAKVDLDQALKWYKKAAAQGHAAAKMRVTYIDIKKNGYQSAKHSGWLKKLKKDAAANDGESLFLLGSLYKKGFILKKDLKKAAEMFKGAVSQNIPGAEAEFESTNAALLTMQKRQQARERQRKLELERKRKEQQQQQISQKKSEEERKRKEAALRAERERIAAEKERIALELEKQRLREERRRLEERRRALLLKQEQEQQKQSEAASEDTTEKAEPKTFDKNICKGKKARFLTICR